MSRIGLGALLLAVLGCRVTLRFDDRAAEAGTTRCVSDGDCHPISLHCDPSSGQCVACVSDGQCTAADRPRCDVALHRCVECGVAQDCGSGYLCEPSTRRCLQTCLSVADCPEDQTCTLPHGICAECAVDGDCTVGGRPYCDPSLRRCVACIDDEQCPDPTRHCDRTVGHCVGCVSSTDCPPSAELCDPTSSTCIVPP